MTEKKISLVSATALSIATMIGSGWLFSAQLSAKYAGNLAFLAWILAALFVMGVGLCLASVVEVFPVTGATSRSSALSHNNIFGMPFAFANWFGILVVVANEAQATGQYLFAAMKDSTFMRGDQVTALGKGGEVAIVLLYLIINFYGIKLLTRFNNTLTIIKIVVPLATIGLLLTTHFDKTNFSLVTNTMYSSHSVINALIGAGLIYSMNGYQTVASFAAEIKNSKRNVPLAIVLSITIVTILYIALQFSFMGAVPHQELVNGWSKLNFSSPLYQLAIILNLNVLAISLVADSIISPSGTGCAYLGSTSRMLFGMSKQGQFPAWFAQINPGDHFSRRSLIFNYIIATIVLLCGDTWAGLMVLVTGCNIIGYMAAPISMGAIKPKNRIFGVIVFFVITLLMTTLPRNDMLVIDAVMSIIMLVYLLTQLRVMSISRVLSFVLPFIIYLWCFYLFPNAYILGVLAIIFYILVTNKKYVTYCAKFRQAEVNWKGSD